MMAAPVSRFRIMADDLQIVDGPMLKGDFVGHPFRGNQWSTAEGQSRGDRPSGSEWDALTFPVRRNTDGTYDMDEEAMLAFQQRQHGGKNADESLSEAIVQYQSIFWYESVNAAVRMTELGLPLDEAVAENATDKEDRRTLRGIIDTLDAAFETHSLDEPVTVYRGISDEDGQIVERLEEGTMSDAGYQSTSLNPVVAASVAAGGIEGEPAAGAQDIVLEIRLPKGFPAMALEGLTKLGDMAGEALSGSDEYDQEQIKDSRDNLGYSYGAEILLPRNIGYTVVAERMDPELGRVFTVEPTYLG